MKRQLLSCIRLRLFDKSKETLRKVRRDKMKVLPQGHLPKDRHDSPSTKKTTPHCIAKRPPSTKVKCKAQLLSLRMSKTRTHSHLCEKTCSLLTAVFPTSTQLLEGPNSQLQFRKGSISMQCLRLGRRRMIHRAVMTSTKESCPQTRVRSKAMPRAATTNL